MTFPLLVAGGMSAMEVNASNFVAVLPANVFGTYTYRSDLASVRKHLRFRLLLAALCGILGSTLPIYTYTGRVSFQKINPWLLLFATLSFSVGPWTKAQLKRHFNFDGSRWMWLFFQLEVLVYVYGGYLGLGMGILMFTIYARFSHMSLHHASAIRDITISLMTVISILIFVRGRRYPDRASPGDDVRASRRKLLFCKGRQAFGFASGAMGHPVVDNHPHRICVLEVLPTTIDLK